MKTLHIIFTVLAIIFLILGIPTLIGQFKIMAQINQLHLQLGVLIGNVVGYLFIPGVFWLARHFVGKKLAEQKNN